MYAERVRLSFLPLSPLRENLRLTACTEYITTLEGDIADRDRLIDAIRTELGSMKSENVALRQEIDALKKDIAELRRALQRKPQHAELYETKKLVSVYTERIANCAACAVTSTPQARLTAKGKENIGAADDSLFGISVDNILSK